MQSEIREVFKKARCTRGSRMQVAGFAKAYAGLLVAALFSPTTHADGVATALSTPSSVPVVVIEANPAVGTLTDVEAHSLKVGTAISGTIQVDTRSNKGAVKMTPQSLKVELLDAQGAVKAVRNVALGPHDVHRHGAKMPQFEANLDFSPLPGERLRLSIE